MASAPPERRWPPGKQGPEKRGPVQGGQKRRATMHKSPHSDKGGQKRRVSRNTETQSEKGGQKRRAPAHSESQSDARGHKRRALAHAEPRAAKRQRQAADLAALEARVQALGTALEGGGGGGKMTDAGTAFSTGKVPEPGPASSSAKAPDAAPVPSSLNAFAELRTFAELPLSEPTTKGLKAAKFVTLTDIQRRAIPLALKGKDILGAAKTGSGKTLAFLVPVLENLWRKQWNEEDGLGALVLAPTRELGIQIFEVLRRIGRYHTFSAGLVIGGRSLQEERERLGRMNILVCTPGRMLQHLDQTALFEARGLQMLVLDEADRILDLGFQSTVDAIIEHLPKGRQTLLFSATQTKRVSDLARLSLKDPEYVSVHQDAASATPATLQQQYVEVPLPEKLDTLWGFLRSNTQSKILIFLSAGKQVRFVYESFRHMQPGISLLHLHGRQKQGARHDIVTRFGAAEHACLIATDVAARGLDFPSVDWVLQVDCPEDADTYIHRVGRTARFEKDGKAVLFLAPSEKDKMLQQLTKKKIPIEEIRVRPNKHQSIKGQLQNMCFRDPELKYLGQKAFVSYARSVYVQKDREVFDVTKLPFEEFAASMGLPGTPRIKFQTGGDAKRLKNAPHVNISDSEEDDGEGDGAGRAAASKTDKKPVRTRYDRMFERVNQDVLAPHYAELVDGGAARAAAVTGNEDGDFLTVKRRLSNASSTTSLDPEDLIPQHIIGSGPRAKPFPFVATSHSTLAVNLGAGREPLLIDSHRREKLLKSKKALLKYKDRGHKLVFDDAGNPHEVYEMRDEATFKAEGDAASQRKKFVEGEGEMLKERDLEDKQVQKAKRREKREKRKQREREDREVREGGGIGLAAFEDGEFGEEIALEDLPLAESNGIGDADGDDGRASDASPKPVTKNGKKKWFQDDSDEAAAPPKHTTTKKKRRDAGPAQTLEDLEALAEGLM